MYGNKYYKLIPYFLLFKILTDQNDEEIDKSSTDELADIYQKTLRKNISETELQEMIDNWKTNEETDLNQMLIILDIIIFGILGGLVSEKNLELDCWKEITGEKFKEIIEIKQSVLLEILKIEESKEFSYSNKSAIGCLTTDILQDMLSKISDDVDLTKEKLSVLLVLLTEFIIRTLVMLFVR